MKTFNRGFVRCTFNVARCDAREVDEFVVRMRAIH